MANEPMTDIRRCGQCGFTGTESECLDHAIDNECDLGWGTDLEQQNEEIDRLRGRIADLERQLAEAQQKLEHISLQGCHNCEMAHREAVAVGKERDAANARAEAAERERDRLEAHCYDVESGEVYLRLKRRVVDLRAHNGWLVERITVLEGALGDMVALYDEADFYNDRRAESAKAALAAPGPSGPQVPQEPSQSPDYLQASKGFCDCEFPYLGAQPVGTPIRCERCGKNVKQPAAPSKVASPLRDAADALSCIAEKILTDYRQHFTEADAQQFRKFRDLYT